MSKGEIQMYNLYGVNDIDCIQFIKTHKELFDDDLLEYIYKNRNVDCINRQTFIDKKQIGSLPENNLQYYEEDGKIYCFTDYETKKLKINPITGKELNKKKFNLVFDDLFSKNILPLNKLVKGYYCPTFNQDSLMDDEIFLLTKDLLTFDQAVKNPIEIDVNKFLSHSESSVEGYRKNPVEIRPGNKLYLVKLKNKLVSQLTKDNILEYHLFHHEPFENIPSSFKKQDWKQVYSFLEKVYKGEKVSQEELMDIQNLNIKGDKNLTIFLGIPKKDKELNEGDIMVIQNDKINKWTKSYCLAEKDGYGGIIVKLIVKPENVVLDMEALPPEYRSVFMKNQQRSVFLDNNSHSAVVVHKFI
jgi:hypothetical protein